MQKINFTDGEGHIADYSIQPNKGTVCATFPIVPDQVASSDTTGPKSVQPRF